MFIFLSQTLMMLSLGVILCVLARTLPRIDDTTAEKISLDSSWLTKRIEEADQKIKIASEKWLRRLNVTLLKLHVSVHKKLARMRKESAAEQNGNHLFTAKEDLKSRESSPAE